MRKFILVLSIVLVGLTLILGLGATNRLDAQERHEKSERQCSNIGIVTDFADNGLYLLDPATNTLSGPYLKGEIGEGNSALNTAVTPGGKTVVITNSNSYALFFVRLPHRSGDPPILLDSVNIGYNAEYVAITPDGKYALITYGGSDPFIAVLDMETRSLRTTYEIPSTMNISGIEIAADAGTVLAADRTNSKIHVLMLEGDGNLTYTHSIALTFQPGSIAVSPGGSTAVVVNPAKGSPAFLRIDTPPGNAVLVEENIPFQCPHGVSAVFSNNGSKVYYLSNNGPGTYIRRLDVPAPGVFTPSSRGIDISRQSAKGETFDSITIEPAGRYAYVWRKVSQLGNPAGIAVIDLTSQKPVKTLSGVNFPVDIAFGWLTTPAAPSKPASNQSPFGSFETPANGSTVRSSIAVTGWALDDGGVESVKIYRQQGSSLVYIGDALFIEGARPDVAAAYPNYPNNTRAGWGYMMLTYFLPNGGNGTFKIYAIAKDTAGHEVTLGVKTIRCDNAHATKPFGAIDTPQPGETISGTNYKITGWALTPPPNKIPENGSTITVRIDGQSIGHVTYNIYRSDIAGFFPGYANSNGAHGYINFDTTQYSNGVHTLEWLVTDNAGNTDGVGSRYFTIENGTSKNSVTIYSNPGDSRLTLIKNSDGREILYLGEKDEQGLPISVSQVIADSEDLDPDKRATIWFDDNSRPIKAILAGGGSMTYEWLENYVIMTAISTDGTEMDTQFVELDQTIMDLLENSNTELKNHSSFQKPPGLSNAKSRWAKGEIHVKCGGDYLSGVFLEGRVKFSLGPKSPIEFKKSNDTDGVFSYRLPLAPKIFPPDVDDFITKLDTSIKRSVKIAKFLGGVGCKFFLKKRVIAPCIVLLEVYAILKMYENISDTSLMVKDFFENGPVFIEVTAKNLYLKEKSTTFFFKNTHSLETKLFDLQSDENFCGMDIRGTWTLNYNWTGYVSGTASITFSGNDKYFGRFSTNDGYSGDYRVNGKSVRFLFDIGTVYWGYITSNNRMAGEMIDYMGHPGTWSAKRSSSNFKMIESNDNVSVIGPIKK